MIIDEQSYLSFVLQPASDLATRHGIHSFPAWKGKYAKADGHRQINL